MRTLRLVRYSRWVLFPAMAVALGFGLWQVATFWQSVYGFAMDGGAGPAPEMVESDRGMQTLVVAGFALSVAVVLGMAGLAVGAKKFRTSKHERELADRIREHNAERAMEKAKPRKVARFGESEHEIVGLPDRASSGDGSAGRG